MDLPSPKSNIKKLYTYKPNFGKSKINNLIRLSANESALGASSNAIKALKIISNDLNRYPPQVSDELVSAISKRYSLSKKKISSQEILRLINLSENFEISELIDNCLAKNKNKIINILNENNFSTEDCIIILRTFLSKTKKILKLAIELEENKDINKTINSAKPPIFWKDKEIVKVQLNKWKTEKIKELIKNINNIELEIKKNYNNSILIVTNFILEISCAETNN